MYRFNRIHFCFKILNKSPLLLHRSEEEIELSPLDMYILLLVVITSIQINTIQLTNVLPQCHNSNESINIWLFFSLFYFILYYFIVVLAGIVIAAADAFVAAFVPIYTLTFEHTDAMSSGAEVYCCSLVGLVTTSSHLSIQHIQSPKKKHNKSTDSLSLE